MISHKTELNRFTIAEAEYLTAQCFSPVPGGRIEEPRTPLSPCIVKLSLLVTAKLMVGIRSHGGELAS